MSEQAQLVALEQLIALLKTLGSDCTPESLPENAIASIASLIQKTTLTASLTSTVDELLTEVYALKRKLTQESEAVPPEATTRGPEVANPVTSKVLGMRAKVSSQRDDAVQKSPTPGARGPR